MIEISEIHEAKILLVDDQQANLRLLERMLRNDGYTNVASTTDPHAVGALYHSNSYDLIILDLEMPGWNGFQVMAELKEAGVCPPLLVISAQPGHRQAALQAGAQDFVGKPFDLAEVRMKIYNLLDAHLQKQRSAPAKGN